MKQKPCQMLVSFTRLSADKNTRVFGVGFLVCFVSKQVVVVAGIAWCNVGKKYSHCVVSIGMQCSPPSYSARSLTHTGGARAVTALTLMSLPQSVKIKQHLLYLSLSF